MLWQHVFASVFVCSSYIIIISRSRNQVINIWCNACIQEQGGTINTRHIEKQADMTSASAEVSDNSDGEKEPLISE